MQGAAVGVEEGGEAADKRCADLIGAEGDRADEGNRGEAAVVGDDAAAYGQTD